MDLAELRKRVEDIAWFHQFEVVPGVSTKGVYDPTAHLQRTHIPANLEGQSVLDIGAWDGYYSFEAERRGASRVLATDSWAWQGRSPLPYEPGDPEPQFGSKRGFDLVREVRESKVEDFEVDVMDLDPAEIGTFDLTLFLGVLYHLKNPVEACERVASVTAGTAVVETVVDQLFSRHPAAAFYPADEQWGDESNWWGTNIACTVGMLKAAGFSRVDVVWNPGVLHRLGSWAKAWATGDRRGMLRSIQQGRAVFHAHRR